MKIKPPIDTTDNEYWPIPICMWCGEECNVTEVVDIGMGEYELWCYCPKCEVDTFHSAKET